MLRNGVPNPVSKVLLVVIMKEVSLGCPSHDRATEVIHHHKHIHVARVVGFLDGRKQFSMLMAG
jgi:hypothetical protein